MNKKPVVSSQNPVGKRRLGRLLLYSTGYWLLATGFFLPGCSSSSRESSEQRSEKTLRDPMGYSPQFEKTDVSGGGLLDYDKEGMRKDLKNVLDP